MLSERIGAFIRGESDESFGELALAVFRWQYERSASLRALGGRNASNPADSLRLAATPGGSDLRPRGSGSRPSGSPIPISSGP